MPLSRATSRPRPTNSSLRPTVEYDRTYQMARAQDQRVVESERHAKKTMNNHRVDERFRDAADGLLIAEPQRETMRERPDAHRDDQRIHPEVEDKKAVDQADRKPRGQRRGDGHADRQTVIDIEDREHRAGEGQIACDRKVVVAGRQRDDKAERDHDDDGLRSEDRGEVRPCQETVWPEIAKKSDRRGPDEQEREPFEPARERAWSAAAPRRRSASLLSRSTSASPQLNGSCSTPRRSQVC